MTTPLGVIQVVCNTRNKGEPPRWCVTKSHGVWCIGFEQNGSGGQVKPFGEMLIWTCSEEVVQETRIGSR